ncbi:VP37A-like protein [Mya arenaria]|uniref:VP37A-like protein n=1 Tax=Mya arenaria TaxID=6604 RepID=A0ABY7DSH8_MYAAR|nr:VP37A-like protein [Mya arenaria]
MPWFGQGNKKGKSTNTELQVQRAKQIEALRRGNLSKLPPQFPQDRPVVEVSPKVHHPWVDQHSIVVNCPNINGFTVQSSLLTAVQAIVEEFMRTPPAVVSNSGFQSAPTSRGYPSLFPSHNIFNNVYPPMPECTDVTNTTTNTASSQSGVQEGTLDIDQPAISDFSQLDIMSTFPELKQKSHSELLELVNEEDEVLEVIQGLPQVTQVVQQRENMAAKCTQLAKDNLAKKPVIEDLKSRLREKFSELESVQREFETSQERHVQLLEQYDPSIIHNNLKVAILEAEEESDRVVDEFIDKNINVDDFISKFLEKRTVSV